MKHCKAQKALCRSTPTHDHTNGAGGEATNDAELCEVDLGTKDVDFKRIEAIETRLEDSNGWWSIETSFSLITDCKSDLVIVASWRQHVIKALSRRVDDPESHSFD